MLIAAGLALASPSALLAQPQLDETRSTLKEWVELKKLISEEQNKWRVEQQTLEESISLLESEIENLKSSIEKQEAGATAAEEARQSLTQQEEALKQASAVVKDAMDDLERQTLEITEYFPSPLKDIENLSKLVSRIPRDNRGRDALSLSQRLMNVIGVLSEIEKFNSQVSVDNEIQEIDGARIQVDTIYFGLAVAYYVDGTGSEAGVMTPAKGGWKKVQDNSLAANVAAAVAMQKREAQPEFVNLPITIQDVE